MKELNLNSDVIQGKKKIPEPKAKISAQTPPIVEPVAMTELPKKKPSKLAALRAIPKKLTIWFQGLSPMKKMLVAGATCVVIASICGGYFYYRILNEPSTTTHVIPSSIPAIPRETSAFEEFVPFVFPSEPRTTPNPINGELYTKSEFENFSSKYPIAVVIENHTSARNQSGYNSADIVYEALAEGGITRTMAIFWGKKVDAIGPIRSARVYFLEWAVPYDPLFMHIGYSITSDPRTNAAGFIYEHGIRSLDRGGTFWRVTEKAAPHNAYSSTDLLYEKAEQYGYTGSPSKIEPWKFKRDAPTDQRGTSTTADIVFFGRLNNGGLYDVTWEYDPDTNTYIRFNNDTPYIDENFDTQVYAKNVIIQRVETISSYDDGARMIITTIGSGDAIILRDGMVIHGTWKKDDVTDRTTFYTTDDVEIEFNRGVTWVEAVPIDQGTVQIDS